MRVTIDIPDELAEWIGPPHKLASRIESLLFQQWRDATREPEPEDDEFTRTIVLEPQVDFLIEP
jgi:hypothetical protein